MKFKKSKIYIFRSLITLILRFFSFRDSCQYLVQINRRWGGNVMSNCKLLFLLYQIKIGWHFSGSDRHSVALSAHLFYSQNKWKHLRWLYVRFDVKKKFIFSTSKRMNHVLKSENFLNFKKYSCNITKNFCRNTSLAHIL